MVKPHELFKGKNVPKLVIVDYENPDTGEIQHTEWRVKPLTPRLLVKNYDSFDALQESNIDEQQGKELSPEQRKSLMKKIDPLIDVVLPHCCVDPKVVFEGETNEKQIHIDDIPLDVLIKLFGEIFISSGMSDTAAKDRNDQKKVPSPKSLPPSVSITPATDSPTKS